MEDWGGGFGCWEDDWCGDRSRGWFCYSNLFLSVLLRLVELFLLMRVFLLVSLLWLLRLLIIIGYVRCFFWKCYMIDIFFRFLLMVLLFLFFVKFFFIEILFLFFILLCFFFEVLVLVFLRRLLRRLVFWRSGSRVDGLRSWLLGRLGRWVLGRIWCNRWLIRFFIECYWFWLILDLIC